MKPTIPQDPLPIVFVGEAPGASEEREGIPFVGESGRDLTRCMASAGIPRERVYLTNVFSERPPGNFLGHFCLKQKEHREYCRASQHPDASRALALPRLGASMYIKPEYVWHLDRLKAELLEWKPNLVVALGNTPLWALCSAIGIGTHRGYICESTLVPGLKVLPTWHPAYILRAWDQRVVLIADLIKASKEMAFPDIRFRNRIFWLDPTIEDLWNFYVQHIDGCKRLSVDIETKRGMVKVVGLAPSPDFALSVPLVDESKPGLSYWSPEDEIRALEFLHFTLCEPHDYEIGGQNYIYDLQYLIRMGLRSRYDWDLMLKHNALWPEMSKSLAFIGSSHLNEGVWKNMRKKSEKRDD